MYAALLYLLVYSFLLFYFDKAARLSLSSAVQAQKATLPLIFNSVTVVKPVNGADDYTEGNFRSWLSQEIPINTQFIFSLQNSKDPALIILDRLRTEFAFEVIVNPVKVGFTGKTSNLFYAEALIRGDILIMSDADIFAPPGALAALAYGLMEPNVCISCLPLHRQSQNVWAHLYALTWNRVLLQLWAPQVVKGKPQGLAGGTLAFRTEDFRNLGGIQRFAGYIAEDIEIGKASMKAGLILKLGPIVYSPVGKLSVLALLQKLRRGDLCALWMNPAGPLATVFGFTVFYGFLAVLPFYLFAHWIAGVIIWSVFYSFRLIMMGRTFQQATGKFRLPLELLVGDPLIVASFFTSIVYPYVNWGGVKCRVRRGGRLEHSP